MATAADQDESGAIASFDPSDIVESLRRALQEISSFHPKDYLEHLHAAYLREPSPAAREAMAQILASSRLAAMGHRPMCQDTGMVTIFAEVGQRAVLNGTRTLQDLANEAVRLAYLDAGNPLRASMVDDPIFLRHNTRDNTPAVLHVRLVAGNGMAFSVAAKGGGSENKAKFVVLNPSASVADWVVRTVEGLGAGWCPPGSIAVGVGGSGEKAMLLAKEALMAPLDMLELLRRGPADRLEELRLELYDRINALGIGAQGLGGVTTVLDVKVATAATHAASLPVALMPQCAANRHTHFTLKPGQVYAPNPPRLSDWPEIALERTATSARKVNLDGLSDAEIQTWRAGETLLLSGHLLTGRDAAHKRLQDMLARGEDLPLSFKGRAIYYVGPVDPVGGEVVGPAGPTTSTRMDDYTDMMFGLGLRVMIGKAERGDATVTSIARNQGAYLIAVGGAAVLVAQAIRAARVVAFEDLGMEAIREFVIEDMPVTVAVCSDGTSVYKQGPERWRGVHAAHSGRCSKADT